jgi:alcohol dehydrogenase class IV
MYAPGGNPVIDALALEGIGALVTALPRIVKDPESGAGREGALYGAWLCGICLGGVGMALHHKLCHTLGGSFGLPHAETHTIVLPHALAYNAPAVPSVMARLKPLFGENPAQGIQDFARRLGAPAALRDIGMPEEAIERAAALAMKAQYPNPRPLDETAIRGTLRRAWAGEATAA